MKIQCDMCEKKEAAVYCTADEASLCHGCDHRVHHANKLANRHPRFALHSSLDQPPLCDICQEKRAFLFCKEDRAILCKKCDITIHGTNHHTKHHNRFLLAGVKLSETSSCYDSSSNQALGSSNSNESSKSSNKKVSIVSKDKKVRASINSKSMEGSSISEYLMETLPGWHVEEFMNHSVSHPYGSYQGYDSGACTLPAHDSDNIGYLGLEDLGNLVNLSSGMDDQISRTGSLSHRFMFDEMESFQKLEYTFNPSSFKRPRQ